MHPAALVMVKRGTSLARWRSVVVLLSALMAMAITGRLGLWQLDRAAMKQSLAAQRAEQQQLAPWGSKQLLIEREKMEDALYRAVEVQGQWVEKSTVFLDNRPMKGRSGFFVVTPLLLDGSNQAVLVQRGWVPRDFMDRTQLPAVPSAPGTVTVMGVLAPPPSQLYQLGQDENDAIRQNIDVVAFAEETGLPLLPVSVLQTGPEDPSLTKAWSLPGVDVAKHHGYAFQWFALCALIGFLYVWFQFISPRRSARVKSS